MSLLSVVAASRNDGHGLNLVARMQTFVDGLADQVDRLGREVELILVDWNPPESNPPLHEVLTAPAVAGLTTRVISVPPAVHSRLSNSSRLSFFQMIAKNAGIRRANGDAVLATNIDILLSDELFRDSTARLDERCLYRTDRVDIAFDPAVTVDPRALRRNAPIRIHKKTGLEYPGFGLKQEQVRGGQSLARVALRDPIDFARRITRSVDGGLIANIDRYRRAFNSIFVLPSLHLNACGDFTLMTRDSWFELRGYPEWELFSWHIDSLLLYQAAAAGFASKEFDGDPAFHLEHTAGWSLEDQTSLFERLRSQGIPYLRDIDAQDVALAMWKGRAQGQWRTNLDGWGMRDEPLAEATLRTSMPLTRQQA